jgi:hypothetical protein
MAEESGLIEISEVAHDPSAALAGAALDLPAPGDRLPTYALDVRGWAIGRDQQVTGVELIAEGAVAGAVPIDVERPYVATEHGVDPRIGFRALLNALALPTEFELAVNAIAATGSRLSIGAVRGRRAALPAREATGLEPLIVTTLGRTGSMLLMRLLEAHPEVLVLRPHRYEQRVAGYWSEVMLALTDPSSHLRQLAPAGSLDRPRWWLGDEGPTPGFNPQVGLARWLGSDAVISLAGISRDRIDALYAEAAAASDKRPRYFAEKHTLRSAAVTSELYPDAPEVFLVRDFRDMLSSILAFNRKRGVRGFGEGSAEGPLDYVGRLAGWAEGLVRRLERRRGQSHVLRYEELVRDTGATLAGLLDYLQVDAGDTAVQTMVASLGNEMPELAHHATSPDPEDSIGRWRSDLDEELKRACARSFGPALEAFGYET